MSVPPTNTAARRLVAVGAALASAACHDWEQLEQWRAGGADAATVGDDRPGSDAATDTPSDEMPPPVMPDAACGPVIAACAGRSVCRDGRMCVACGRNDDPCCPGVLPCDLGLQCEVDHDRCRR
jgi:hypothetical protein